MGDRGSVTPTEHELLRTLQSQLQSGIHISQPEILTFEVGRGKSLEQEGVIITIIIQNTASESSSGGNVVFMGVGLSITDGRERADSKRWATGISISNQTNDEALRQKYQQGAWTSKESFPALTPYEIRVESLNDNQMADLNRIKVWLYHKRTQVRQEKDRSDRRQKRDEVEARRKTEQPVLFEF